MKNKKVIGIIGCGSMGSAIIGQNKIAIIFDKDPKKNAYIKKRYHVKVAFDIQELVSESDIIIIAVKPQDIGQVLNDIKSAINNQLIISIAAGISINYIENKIGGKARIIRVMPNMAAQVRSGISAICKGRFAENNDLLIAENIFRKLGKVERVEEDCFDAFTAIAGSGPAYFFYFIEALSEAGKKLGFSEKMIASFVKEVGKGSIKLLEETGLSASELREKVASKGGTTEAALNVFKNKKLNAIIKEAILKATKRAKELSKGG
jgi:pyrroline-5-carboxylate reductase